MHITAKSDTNLILHITASNDTNLMCKLHWTATQTSHVYTIVKSHTNLTCANCSKLWHKPHLCTTQWPQSSAGKQCRMLTGWAEYLHKTNRKVWVSTAPDSWSKLHSPISKYHHYHQQLLHQNYMFIVSFIWAIRQTEYTVCRLM